VGAKRDLIQFDFLDLLSLKSGAASEVCSCEGAAGGGKESEQL
jgi:hypothetical protein